MHESELASIRSAFLAVAALPATERQRYLDEHFAGRSELHAKVHELLGYHDAPQPLLDDGASPVAHHPERIGRYRVLGVLGSGGIGIVYRAEQDRPRRSVALKLLQPGQVRPETLQRFAREADLLARLQHPGIAQIHEAGSFDAGFGETPFFAMELVEGESLTRYANARECTIRQRCELVLQVCDAVQHAHERGVVHRDLKPDNILVSEPTPGDPRTKVLDFGIARVVRDDDAFSTLITHTGQLVGTLPYMSPEQVSGGAVDARCDVYALGAILYELLGGRVPLDLEGRPLTQVVRIVTEEEPERISTLVPGLSRDLDTIVAVALAKEPDRRYPSVQALAADLRRSLADAPIVARPQTTFYRLLKFARRNRALVGGTLATLLVLVAGIVGVGIYSVKNRELAASEHAARQGERRNRYLAEMNLAGNALATGGIARVRQLVDAWRADPADQDDPRGFEWHFLDAASRGSERILDTGRVEYSVAWLSDTLLATQEDRGAAIHSLAGGIGPERIEVEANEYVVAAASRDARWLAISRDRDIQVFDARTKVLRTTLPVGQPSGWIVWFASQDRLGALLRDGTIEIWDVAQATLVSRIGGTPAFAFAFSADGRRYVRTLVPSGVEIGDVDAGSPPRTLGTDAGPCFACALSPDGTLVAFGGRNRSTRVLEIATGKCVGSIEHEKRVIAIAWSPDGQLVAAGGHDCVVQVLTLGTGETTRLRGHGNTVLGLAWSADGLRLASASEDGTLRIWPRAPRTPIRRVGLARRIEEETPVARMAWDAERALTISVPGDPFTYLLRPDDQVTRVPGFIARAPSGMGTLRYEKPENAKVGLITVVTDDGTRSDRWELGDRTAFQWGHCGPLPNSDGSILAAALMEPKGPALFVWHPFGDRAPSLVHRGPVTSLAWRPDGKALAWLSNDGVYCGDPERGALAPERTFERATILRWSPDGGTLAVVDSFRRIHLFAPGSADLPRILRGHTLLIRALDWSPDGSRIASGGNDHVVKIWDVASGRETLTLPASGDICGLCWRQDGKALAALSSDGVVTVWSSELDSKR